MSLKLAAELAEILPTVKEVWTFSSQAGWYLPPSDDTDAWPMFWDGTWWHDPVGDIEGRIIELLIPHLEETFKQGFVAGYAAATESSEDCSA